jgi:hypothetical protein
LSFGSSDRIRLEVPQIAELAQNNRPRLSRIVLRAEEPHHVSRSQLVFAAARLLLPIGETGRSLLGDGPLTGQPSQEHQKRPDDDTYVNDAAERG